VRDSNRKRRVINSNFLVAKTSINWLILLVYLSSLKTLKSTKILKTLNGLYAGRIAKRSTIDEGDTIYDNLPFRYFFNR